MNELNVLQRIHTNSQVPIKSSKLNPLNYKEKKSALKLSKIRVKVEHLIGKIKIFKLIAERYRNRKKTCP